MLLRVSPTSDARTDGAVPCCQLCGSRGVTDRTLLYNPDVSTVFARGTEVATARIAGAEIGYAATRSTRCFEVRVAEDLGDLTAMTESDSPGLRTMGQKRSSFSGSDPLLCSYATFTTEHCAPMPCPVLVRAAVVAHLGTDLAYGVLSYGPSGTGLASVWLY
eukprot:467753-Rhodomonas_salina.1